MRGFLRHIIENYLRTGNDAESDTNDWWEVCTEYASPSWPTP